MVDDTICSGFSGWGGLVNGVLGKGDGYGSGGEH